MKILFIYFLSLILLSGCAGSGYKAKPERLTLGFPIWFGGPSMTWSFEEINE